MTDEELKTLAETLRIRGYRPNDPLVELMQRQVFVMLQQVRDRERAKCAATAETT